MDCGYKILDPVTVGLRERNLQAARALVREAALEAFLGEGYVGTTMADLARRAGVARQTVYNLYESKAALLIEVIGHQVAAPAVRDQAADRRAVLTEVDPETLIRRFAASHRGVVERGVPIMRVALQAASVDEVVARHLREQEQRRVAATGDVVDALAATGALRQGAATDELRRGFAVLTSPTVAIAALDGGMTLDELERWTVQTAEGLLLAH